MSARKRGIQRGAATVEFALVAPILVVLVLWANYFWELQRVRLKATEMARFMAFERTVRTKPDDLRKIAVEARERYQDLDGSTRTGELGTAYRNRLTLNVRVEPAAAPLFEETMEERASESRTRPAFTEVLGTKAEDVAGMMQLNADEGAVQATVMFDIENAIIPEEIAFYTTGLGDRLNIHITEQFFLIHDTWRAWEPGDHPDNSYDVVEQRTYDRVKHLIDGGMKKQAGAALSASSSMMSLFRLDDINDDSYLRESVRILPVDAATRYSAVNATYTVPGTVLQAAYWQNDTHACFGTCEPQRIKTKRGLINTGGYDDNWPMRAYNCRGDFFQGATQSELPESVYADSAAPNNTVGGDYHNYGDRACRP
jgi:Flp pilus assembly protein TadG